MDSLAAKYKHIKTLVGGNREKTQYEESFGMPQEELYYITMPAAPIRRILAQAEFSIRLSKELNGMFEKDVEAALDFLQEQLDRDGVLTKQACLQAEQLLLPLAPFAKEYSLILAAHAHIDMNWMWSWNETVAATIATFQTMLKLMEEYPDFCFSQSQASVYKIIDDYAPELKPQMQKYIKEGRWEVTASAWVETDKNMPNTESLLQQIYQTKKYLRDNWDIAPEKLNLDFSPDTFGHSAHLPELDALGGVDYYYHCRGLDGDNALYRWKAPSGKEMLVYREQYWYNSGITPLIGIGLIDIVRRSGGLKTGLIVYGVGDHGGGPTRRDLERAIEMQDWPVFPAIRFGTFGEFFREAEAVREKLPVVDRELNFILNGCYTTQSRIKMANRRTEAMLYDAQLWDALAQGKAVGTNHESMFSDAWQKVLFTHFHDILTGSCVQDSREHAMGEFSGAAATAQSRASLAMQALAGQIDTSDIHIVPACAAQSEGAGAGYGIEHFAGMPAPERGLGRTRIYHLFNSAAVSRQQPVEITVWDWTGDLREISFTDGNGAVLPFQLLDTQLQKYWDHRYFRVLVYTAIPPLGYTTVILREGEPQEYRIYYQPEIRTTKPTEDIVLENECLCARFCYQSGELISLVDKSTQQEMLSPGETGGLRYVSTECATSSAWLIGRYLSVEKPQSLELKPFAGSLCSGFTLKQKVHASEITTTVSLGKNAKALTLDITADWHEIAGETIPVLIYRLPITGTSDFVFDVPGGSVHRGPQNLEVPGLQYAAAVFGTRALLLSSDCKYGYRCTENALISTLINASNSPDPYPERGIHKIKLFVGVEDAQPAALAETAFCLCHQVAYQSGTTQSGSLPKTGSLLALDSGTALISGISIQEGALTLRLYETAGKKTTVSISSPLLQTEKAACCDLMGSPTPGTITPGTQKAALSLEAYQITMVKIPLLGQ